MNLKRWKNRRLGVEALQDRLCLASVGWDGPGLGSAELTYYLGEVPDSLDADVVRSALETAFEAWSSVVDVSFTPTNRPNLRDSIDIRFEEIDGRNGTLAQAYFPDDVVPFRRAGDIEFDIDENWEVGNSQGRSAFDLVLVAAHEIGHALGLDHLPESEAVLFASVSPSESFTELSTADIDAILDLYAPVERMERPNLRGDLNADGFVNGLDVDLLTNEILDDDYRADLDVNLDGRLDELDRNILVDDLLQIPFGDANLDGEFNSADFVDVFQLGRYEADERASWSGGDWNGDGRFDSSDFVFAFQAGSYTA